MSVKELMELCFEHDLKGKEIDQCFKVVGVNLLRREVPVVPIPIAKPDQLLCLMKSADNVHMYISGGVFHLNALYSEGDGFPATRIYFMKTEDLLELSMLGSYFEDNGIKLVPTNDKDFSKLINEAGYENRYLDWLTRWEENKKMFSGLLDGRINNTVVEKGIWLSRDGKCLICGEQTETMCTATIIGKIGVMVGLKLCTLHEKEAEDEATILEFVAKKMKVPVPFFHGSKITLGSDDHIALTCHALINKLDFQIEKIVENTITAIRNSGFRIVVKQKTLTNYAYNILDPNKKSISRIDSADDHKIPYGPDHVHRQLTNRQKNKVEPSFTYGMPLADIKAIKRLIEDAENEWVKNSKLQSGKE